MLNNKARDQRVGRGRRPGRPRDSRGVGGRTRRPLDEVELTLDEIEGGQEVEFEFRPTVKGRHTYTVRVPPLEEERIEENNARSGRSSLVVEPGIRVLYVEGTLRAEYGAIVATVSLQGSRPAVLLVGANASKRVPEAVEHGGTRPGQHPLRSRDVSTLFDVFMIGDLDSSYLVPEQQAHDRSVAIRERRPG